MAVNTILATPENLIKGQEISIKESLSEAPCWNDSKLLDPHYQAMPREIGNPKAVLYAAGLPSILLTDGNYAIAVSRYESLRYTGPFEIAKLAIEDAGRNNRIITSLNGEKVTPINGTYVTEENGNAVFRKLVWMKFSDLVLGSYAQQSAITDAATAAQEKYLKDLANGKPPGLGNIDTPKSGSTIWIILAVLLAIIGGIWALIAKAKKRRDKAEAEKKSTGSNVNIIRIPKNT